MMMVNWQTVVFLVSLAFVNCDVQQIKSYDPNYGITWMFMPDENGNALVVDLMPPNDTSKAKKPEQISEDVTFYYYRQSTMRTPTPFRFSNDPALPLTLENSYDPTLPTKFIIHGYTNSVNNSICQEIKNAYLMREDQNVIVVDWSPLAGDIIYYRSASATRDVGRHVAGLIDRMIAERGTELDRVHLIGHSLGAHTSGFAGLYVRTGKVARITALDPALPGFHDQQPDKLVDSSDAMFVDVIHTCAGLLGHDKSLGHVDFWPNGGRPSQPGCSGLNDFAGTCSHGRSWEFFAESISRPDAFEGVSCATANDFANKKCRNNPIPMGDATPTDTRGDFYLATNGEPEYGRGLD